MADEKCMFVIHMFTHKKEKKKNIHTHSHEELPNITLFSE